MLRSAVPPKATGHLWTYATNVGDFVFPDCDLVWGSFAYPFCCAHGWQELVQRISIALNPGGRMAGDLFGDRHAWAGEEGVVTLSEREARASVEQFNLEAFDVEDGHRVSGGQVTRWHAFGVIARKQAIPATLKTPNARLAR
jgi:hypothetical protein